MFSLLNCLLSCVILLLYSSKACTGDIPSPSLVLYIPGEPEWTDVLVRRVGDNLTLVCELRGGSARSLFVWNVRMNGTDGVLHKVDPSPNSTGTTTSSILTRDQLQVTDSGQYICSSPPFSVTKYILVQPIGPKFCGRGTFWCGQRCMAAQYVCDGRADCANAEDESETMCDHQVCSRPEKLNCSTGRCISESACCKTNSPICQHPSCCDEHPRNSRLEGFVDVEYPPLYEDRHAPDDYGFIQSTIYTVTACALIFMLAVVLLVSAICKMHMKRAALRSYAHAERATRQHYNMQYAQTHRFPPCYEASRLLEAEARAPASPVRDPPLQCNSECPPDTPETPSECGPSPDVNNGSFGLSRLTAIFSSRYRQVPTQSDVELTNVRSTSLNNSPTRNRTLDNYRSPTYCDLNTSEFFFTNPDTADYGRDLNYMATPIELMRNRNSSIERVIDQLDRQRLTLQLGRFQLSIPRFGRRNETDRRPDTPNVAEINIDDLDFVRMTSHDTYTLNGRTIRLLGANFENYPVLPDGTRPPPYNEAMRCKFFGPPPEYLSRDGLNARVDEEARNNIEMPPCYDELNGEAANNNNSSVPTGSGNNDNNLENNNNNNDSNSVRDISIATTSANNSNRIINNNNNLCNNSPVITVTNVENDSNSNNNNNNNVQSISSIINNLPAIDSDVNANDTVVNC